MENQEILDMKDRIKSATKYDNKSTIKSGDIGYFRTKDNPRLFLQSLAKDFIEAYCLCKICYDFNRNDRTGFGVDVNGSQRGEYFIVGNVGD